MTFQQKAKTVNHTDIPLEEILFYGKLIVHSNLFSGYTYEKVTNYKNYLVTQNNITHHILLSRPQKILRAESIEELGRTILYPLYPDNIFSTNVLEEFHQMYCSKDTTYPISKMLKEQLFHKNMKAMLSKFNQTCPLSCIYRSLSLEERYRIYNPMGLGGSIQFKAIQDVPSRMNSVICDLMGPYMTECKGRNCHNKIWLLLLLNPSTQFLSIEILQNQSTSEVISGLIRHMSKYGSKNVFLSDNESHFWPLRTKYATSPKTAQTSLPPLWRKLINDVKILNAHSGHLWLFFSMGHHEALSRIEKMVHRIKQHLKRTQIFDQFSTPRYSCPEIETFWHQS